LVILTNSTSEGLNVHSLMMVITPKHGRTVLMSIWM